MKKHPAKKIDKQPLEEVVKAMPDKDEDGMDNDGDGEVDEGDEDEDEDEGKKSEIDDVDLQKALNEMDNLVKAQANGISLRQAALAGKLAKGEKLSKAETDELISLTKSEETLEKSHKEQLVEDPKVEQAFEVSEFLDAFGTKLGETLDANRTEMRKSFAEINEFHKAIARVLVEQAKEIRLLKSQLETDTEVITPVKAAPQAAPAKGVTSVGKRVNDIQKSEGGTSGPKLTPEMILDTMDELVKSDRESGIDWMHSIAMYEGSHQLKRDAVVAIAKKRGIDPAQLGL